MRGVVENLDDVGRFQESAQRRQVAAGHRVDQRAVAFCETDLHEAKLGVVRPFPDKLGVEGDAFGLQGTRNECFQRLRRCNHAKGEG